MPSLSRIWYIKSLCGLWMAQWKWGGGEYLQLQWEIIILTSLYPHYTLRIDSPTARGALFSLSRRFSFSTAPANESEGVRVRGIFSSWQQRTQTQTDALDRWRSALEQPRHLLSSINGVIDMAPITSPKCQLCQWPVKVGGIALSQVNKYKLNKWLSCNKKSELNDEAIKKSWLCEHCIFHARYVSRILIISFNVSMDVNCISFCLMCAYFAQFSGSSTWKWKVLIRFMSGGRNPEKTISSSNSLQVWW